MIHNSGSARRKQAGAGNRQASSMAPQRNNRAGDFARYESLKKAASCAADTAAGAEGAKEVLQQRLEAAEEELGKLIREQHDAAYGVIEQVNRPQFTRHP